MKPTKRGRKPKVQHVPFIDNETTCPVCFAEFLDPEDLAQHKTYVHPEPARGLLKCQFCDALKTDLEDFLIHLRDEHMANLLCCIFCARAFIDPEEHKAHENKHSSDVSGMLACSNCKVLFNSVAALETHELNCSTNCKNSIMLQEYYPHLSSILNTKADDFMQSLGNEATYSCCICKIVTSKLDVYLRHLKKSGCRSLACNSCYQVFRLKLNLRNHLTCHIECSHIPCTERLMKQCGTCRNMFDVDLIKNHRKRCKEIKCIHCKQIFDTVTELTEHQRKDHPMSLILRTCRYCRQLFGGLTVLRKHMKRAHSDYRMYKYTCVHCPEFFKHPNLLFNHFFFKHKELRPFSCKICNETFNIRRKFSLHIKLKHSSVGFVEFDEYFNVYFCSEKSAKPFQPKENSRLFNDDEKLSDEPSDATEIDTDVEVKQKTLKKKKRVASRVKPITGSKNYSNTPKVDDKEKVDIEPLTRKRRRLQKRIDEFNDSSDEDSLLSIVKLASKKRQMQMQMTKINKHKFSNRTKSLSCNICKKICFTTDSYHRHMTMHYKNDSKRCPKCSQYFISKDKLDEHMKRVHSVLETSETLTGLLERRKAELNQTTKQVTHMSEKFQKTIKKVAIPPPESHATLTPTEGQTISVRNFLESFTPEVNEAGKKITVKDSVTVKPLFKHLQKQPKIKFTKYVEKPSTENPGLAMPTPFKHTPDQVKAKIQLHRGLHRTPALNFGTPIVKENVETEDNYQEYEDDGMYPDDEEQDNNTSIPEVAQEVMLEHTDEPARPMQISHKLMIPKTDHKIKIAHLQQEAPYFKIVSFDDVIKGTTQKPPEKEEPPDICLPSGTKLVHANPLAHLLDGKDLEEFRKSRERKLKYQPKVDHKSALRQALINLENPKPRKKRTYQKKIPKKAAPEPKT